MTVYELDRFGFLALNTQANTAQSFFDRFGTNKEDAWRNSVTAANGQFSNGYSFTQRNHILPLGGAADKLQILRDFAMFKDASGVPYFDPYNFATAGRELPNSGKLAVPTLGDNNSGQLHLLTGCPLSNSSCPEFGAQLMICRTPSHSSFTEITNWEM